MGKKEKKTELPVNKKERKKKYKKPRIKEEFIIEARAGICNSLPFGKDASCTELFS